MQIIHPVAIYIYLKINYTELGNVIPFFKYPFTSNKP